MAQRCETFIGSVRVCPFADGSIRSCNGGTPTRHFLPKSTMGKAVTCALAHWESLPVYLNEPKIEIDKGATQIDLTSFGTPWITGKSRALKARHRILSAVIIRPCPTSMPDCPLSFSGRSHCSRLPVSHEISSKSSVFFHDPPPVWVGGPGYRSILRCHLC